MKRRKYLELPSTEAKEYNLLMRRAEWLEMKNSVGYRISDERRSELNKIYADVSMDTKSFCEILGN